MKTKHRARELVRSLQRTVDMLPERPLQRVNPFARSVDKLCQVHVVRADECARPDDGTFRVVFVSMPSVTMKISRFSALLETAPELDDAACARSLALVSAEESRLFLQTFENALAVALGDLKANVVCVNELGFPSSDGVPLPAAAQYAHRMAQAHNSLIVAGSAHDARTLYNSGAVFHPGGPHYGVPFHKLNSATTIGEIVSTPPLRRILAVQAFGVGIAIMFGFDLLDYSCVTSVVKAGEHVDMVLAICHMNRVEKCVQVALTASKALAGMVALVNADIGDAVGASCHVARFGVLEPPTETTVLPSGALLSTVTINHQAFLDRRDLRATADAELEWLFGSSLAPRLHV